jgi:hypothetical protein
MRSSSTLCYGLQVSSAVARIPLSLTTGIGRLTQQWHLSMGCISVVDLSLLRLDGALDMMQLALQKQQRLSLS